MITETVENATKDANVGAQGATVAPEKVTAKKRDEPTWETPRRA
jgi:hypothetical protein